jgi:hypothetical protein
VTVRPVSDDWRNRAVVMVAIETDT